MSNIPINDNNLINKIIEDTTNKEGISDGVFTLGELHSDRLSLYVTLISFILKIYQLKGSDISEMLWYSGVNCLGTEAPNGYIHLGITLGDKVSVLGALVPKHIVEHLPDAKKIDAAPNYKPLYESLNFIKF